VAVDTSPRKAIAPQATDPAANEHNKRGTGPGEVKLISSEDYDGRADPGKPIDCAQIVIVQANAAVRDVLPQPSGIERAMDKITLPEP